MVDLTEDCRASLEPQKQGPVSVDELRKVFCRTCRNIQCSQIETGPNDPMGKRAALQIERLLHPTIVDPKLPKFAPVAHQDFADAKNQAEAWDIGRPAPQVVDFKEPEVRPELMAAQRIPGQRQPLRNLPEQPNAPLPPAARPLPAASRAPDPWNPSSGGMVVKSGATLTLGPSGITEKR